MEDRTILDDTSIYNNSTGLSSNAKSYLSETAGWGKFLSITGLAILGLMFILLMGGGLMGFSRGMSGLGRLGIFGLTTIPLFIIFTIPSFYLYKFSTTAQDALDRKDDNGLTDAFRYLKSLYKFWGIITILWIAFNAFNFIRPIF